MPSWLFLWDEEEGGNVEHLGEHDLTPEDAEHAFNCLQAHEEPLQRTAGYLQPECRWAHYLRRVRRNCWTDLCVQCL
jgi:hypothetical protein